MVSEFQMIDPTDQNNKLMIITPGDHAQGVNLKHKRKSSSDYNFINKRSEFYEKLSLIAYEGSTLTLMGLVKYDKTAYNGQGGFKMTEVGGFLVGGLSECKRLINMEIADTKALLTVFGLLNGVCGLLIGLIIYNKIKARRMERQIE